MHTLLIVFAVATAQEGLWSVDTTFGPGVRGELRVRRASSGWTATIPGRTATVERSGDSVRFTLPDSGGQFRGVLAGRAIRGFWIQPRGAVTGYAWASPLELTSSGGEAGEWRGSIVPLEERWRVYLAISRRPNGTLVAVFRNPEQNDLGKWFRFSVTRAGDSLRFDLPASGEDQPAMQLAATYDSVRRVIALAWPGLDRVLRFAPQDSASATGLFARLPRAARYVYRQPGQIGDGWHTARAKDAGFDEAALARLVQQIADTDPLNPRAPLMHSLLMARHGRLVLEEYFAGYDRRSVHDTRSAAKTFASVMAGAIGLDPGTRVKGDVTVGHLLTHTSGLACDDYDPQSPGEEVRMRTQTAQPDWWQYILDQPQVYPPGTHYAYCSGGMNLAGYALHGASGTWIPALFDRTVARPLGFGRYYWDLMPTLEGYLGGGVQMLPRDLLKLGVTYLNGGVWDGRRIVPAEWVARSTVNQVAEGVGTDGYAWHLGTLKVGDREYREYEANGNGGQFLIVVPELDLAVVFTGGNYMYGGVWLKWRQGIVGDVIIPAIRE